MFGLALYYTTLDAVLLHLHNGSQVGLNAPSQANDLAFLTYLIRSASDMASDYAKRTFIPYLRTHTCGVQQLYDTSTIRLPDSLLDVTTVTDGNGDNVDTGDVERIPPDDAPGVYLRRTDAAWTLDTLQARVEIEGLWGYHERYSQAWLTAYNLTGDINSSVTSLTVADADDFERCSYLKIGGEFLLITDRDTDANTLTVTRGVNGSTAAAHTTGAAVQRYLQNNRLQWATTEIVAWAWKNRHRVNEVFAVPGGVVRTGELSPDIWQVIDSFSPETQQIEPYR